MSSDCQREMTLDEWVERFPEVHRARKEYAALKAEVEKLTAHNTSIVKFLDCSKCIKRGMCVVSHVNLLEPIIKLASCIYYIQEISQ